MVPTSWQTPGPINLASDIDNAFAERNEPDIGAEIIGRGKFGPQTGLWTGIGTEDEWRGWWRPNPPFHTPVFVMTDHPRPSLEIGRDRVPFRDGSPQAVLDRAREAAASLDVRIGGGPTILRDFLAEQLVDTIHAAQVPIILGRGVRLWGGLEELEERYDVETAPSPSGITHLTFTRRT